VKTKQINYTAHVQNILSSIQTNMKELYQN